MSDDVVIVRKLCFTSEKPSFGRALNDFDAPNYNIWPSQPRTESRESEQSRDLHRIYGWRLEPSCQGRKSALFERQDFAPLISIII